jgi:NADH dehydrogenase FAD-containing subunit
LSIVAILRGLLRGEGEFSDILVPFNSPTHHHVAVIHHPRLNFIQERVVEISISDKATGAGKVVDSANNSLDFDYLVLAIGSRYSNVIKPCHLEASEGAEFDLNTIKGRISSIKSVHNSIKQASSIVIVGAGLVGVELAAEIAEFLPGKPCFLHTKGSTILPSMGRSAQFYSTKWLNARQIHIVYDSELNPSDYQLSAELNQTGEIVFDCTGIIHQALPHFYAENKTNQAKPQEMQLAQANREEWGESLTAKGFIRVNSALQLVKSHKNSISYSQIYALGDCSDQAALPKMAYTAEIQGTATAINIARQFRAEMPLSYPELFTSLPSAPMLLIGSLGSQSGFLVFNSITINGFIAGAAKWYSHYSQLLRCALLLDSVPVINLVFFSSIYCFAVRFIQLTKTAQYRGQLASRTLWHVAEPLAFWVHRFWALFFSITPQPGSSVNVRGGLSPRQFPRIVLNSNNSAAQQASR